MPAGPRTLSSGGLRFELTSHGAIGRIDVAGVTFNLFPGLEVDGGPANLWLRRHGADSIEATPLLGPRSPMTACTAEGDYQARGLWQGLDIRLQLRLAGEADAWFWHVNATNLSDQIADIDLIMVHDVGLSPYAAIRLNEHYVSHYVDLTALHHPGQGTVLAARQNLAVGAGRHSWALMGSLRRAVAHATDARQVQGLGTLAGEMPRGIAAGLPSTRLQHEHALMALQDERLTLRTGEQAQLGFFVRVVDHHGEPTGASDLDLVARTLALPEAAPSPWLSGVALCATAPRSLFASAPWLPVHDLDETDLVALFGPERRHEELSDEAALLSFFHGEHSHVVLRAKELRVQRPHGHILRTGQHLAPDETSLTSTVWMNGVFNSMVTQGHVSINRFLSTARGQFGQFRAPGQRLFVHVDGVWTQLGMPSAFEIEPGACRWIYKHAGGLIEVRGSAEHAPHALRLHVRMLRGAALRLRVSHHIALGGDDGRASAHPVLTTTLAGVTVQAPPGSDMAARFPGGSFLIEPDAGTRFAEIGGVEMLHEGAHSWGEPFVCMDSGDPVLSFGLRIRGQLIGGDAAPAGEIALPTWAPPAASALAPAVQRLADALPWFLHNAMVHFLSPRGLEQYSGGGWGTRDVCQGPLELLLALGHTTPVRELLCRVFAAQKADGDWPQWFMFFERDRALRAGDSHGDIVFWPLLGLAQYLIASGDASLLDQALPFHAAAGEAVETGTVWQHVERARTVIAARRIEGTELAAYGHGDWNDSLQPADPALRERLCSAWTVTLDHQTHRTLAEALRGLGRPLEATALFAHAAAVQTDFQRLLVRDGVITGYALFPPGETATMLLHPADTFTDVHYSLLPMVHAVLEDMLTPEQTQRHLGLIATHLTGPDGARLFDRPLPYRGGPMQLFQRAEGSAFFGREIGLMYMHAHLRYVQALAHVGNAQGTFDALCKSHPIALRELVPSASLRQSNCYYSSSDAAFADRAEAREHYADVASGKVALDGGWRIYSSGPGLAIATVLGSFLGIRRELNALVIDPVIAPALDGLCVGIELCGHRVEIEYRLGRAGFGPVSVELNGTALPFTRRPNPHRVGAAAVPMSELHARLGAWPHRLVVHTG